MKSLSQEYFLDTCIYIGYAGFDPIDSKCKKICDDSCPKYTSLSVKNEIDGIMRDYRAFQKEFTSAKCDLNALINSQKNDNRRRSNCINFGCFIL